MIKILGVIQQLPEPIQKTGSNDIYGRHVAIESWILALIDYGTYDEYHFYVSNFEIDKAISRLQGWLIINPNFKKVKIFRLKDLIHNIKNLEYFAFHNPDQLPNINKLINIRNKYSTNLFPVTGGHHALSYGSSFDEFKRGFLDEYCFYDGIVCTSEASKKVIKNMITQIKKFYDRRSIKINTDIPLYRIPLGVDSENTFFPREKKVLRKFLRLPEEGTIFLWMGRLSEVDKADLSILLRVFSKLITKNKNLPVYLVIAGDDKYNYSQQILSLVSLYKLSNAVIVITSIPYLIPPLYYAACDVFLSPVDSLQESFGLSLLEAMASGLPVIASDWNGYKDIIKNNETGYLVKTIWGNVGREESSLSSFDNWIDQHYYLSQSIVVDDNELLYYMQLLLTNEKLRKKMSDLSRKRAMEIFNWKGIIRKYEEMWSELNNIKDKMSIFYKQNQEDDSFSYNQLFSHYPTLFVTKEGFVRKETHKIDIQHIFFLNKNPRNTVSFEIVSLIKNQFNNSDTLAVSEIFEELKKYDEEVITHSLLWLIKQGLLSYHPVKELLDINLND